MPRRCKDNGRLFTHITNVLAKDKEISDRWRGYEDIADSRHMANSVEREVVDALETAVREAYPRLSHRYYKMKAKWFGKDKLNAWDRNAPLPTSDERTFDWETAKTTVLEAYGKFSPEAGGSRRAVLRQRLDRCAGQGGQVSGAFAHPTVPSAHPYLMLNYLGNARDVMTLAHELGHGVHQVLAAAQGPLIGQHAADAGRNRLGVWRNADLPLDAGQDHGQEAALRDAVLQGRGHAQHGGAADRLLYLRAQGPHGAPQGGAQDRGTQRDLARGAGESLGPGIKLNEGYDIFWTYIPHFIHSPFYVYAYAFGDCLVNSLYAQYEKASDGFAERYFELLKAGGSKHHSELLKPFGLDARDPDFWSLGLSMIERLIGELEATTA